MKEIKTVWIRADQRISFEEEVNKLINEGFTLDKYEICPSHHSGAASMLFALLFR